MTDCCDSPGLMPLDEGLRRLLNEIAPVSDVENVSLDDSLDRVLASDVVSPVNVPSHDNSAMDGYALRLVDLEVNACLPLAGQSLAGHPFMEKIPEGHCIRIMTGASIPEGADTVIMQENTEQTDEGILFKQKPEQTGNNIRLAGEDIKSGCQVFSRGHKVRAQDVGLLASLGVPELKVYRKVKVAVFSTGDELRLPGETLGHGDIYDSNRFAVKAMLKRLGADIIDLGRIADDKAALRAAFAEADREADAVITSGGVSVGDADFVKDILNETGHTSFWKLAIKPGKPFAFGKLPNSYFFGLPGNPVSATVTFQQLASPALQHLMGSQPAAPIEISAICRSEFRRRPGRQEFVRGIASRSPEGHAEVVTTGSQGSGILRSMSMANCYIVVPADQGGIANGDRVTVQMFDNLFL